MDIKAILLHILMVGQTKVFPPLENIFLSLPSPCIFKRNGISAKKNIFSLDDDDNVVDVCAVCR